MQDNDRPTLVRVGTAATKLGVSPDTLRRLTARGSVRCYVAPGSNQRRYDLGEIERLAKAGWSQDQAVAVPPSPVVATDERPVSVPSTPPVVQAGPVKSLRRGSN